MQRARGKRENKCRLPGQWGRPLSLRLIFGNLDAEDPSVCYIFSFLASRWGMETATGCSGLRHNTVGHLDLNLASTLHQSLPSRQALPRLTAGASRVCRIRKSLQLIPCSGVSRHPHPLETGTSSCESASWFAWQDPALAIAYIATFNLTLLVFTQSLAHARPTSKEIPQISDDLPFIWSGLPLTQPIRMLLLIWADRVSSKQG